MVALELSLKSLEILSDQSNPHCSRTIWISRLAYPFFEGMNTFVRTSSAKSNGGLTKHLDHISRP